MSDVSHHGTGLRIHGIRVDGDFVIATLWLTIFFVPLIPLRRAKCTYLGDSFSVFDSGFSLSRVERLPLSVLKCIRTYCITIASVSVAILPAATMIWRVHGRAATKLEFVVVLLAATWPLVVIHSVERRNKHLLSSTWSKCDHAIYHDLTTAYRQANCVNWNRNHYFSDRTFGLAAVAAFFTGIATGLMLGCELDVAQFIGLGFVIVGIASLFLIDRWLFQRNGRTSTNAAEQ